MRAACRIQLPVEACRRLAVRSHSRYVFVRVVAGVVVIVAGGLWRRAVGWGGVLGEVSLFSGLCEAQI
jgi:hypothetical protein